MANVNFFRANLAGVQLFVTEPLHHILKSTWKCITLAYKFNRRLKLYLISHKVPCVHIRVRLLGGAGLQDYLAQNCLTSA